MQEPLESFREPTWFEPGKAQEALSEDRDLEYAEELRQVVRKACDVVG